MPTVTQQWVPIIWPVKDNAKLYNLTWQQPRNNSNPIHIWWVSHDTNTVNNISTTMTLVLLPMNCGERQTISLKQYDPIRAFVEQSQTLVYQPRCSLTQNFNELEQCNDILIIVFGLIIINILLFCMINLYRGAPQHKNPSSGDAQSTPTTPTSLEVPSTSPEGFTSLARTPSNITWRSNCKENPVYMVNKETAAGYDTPKPVTRFRGEAINNEHQTARVYEAIEQITCIQTSPSPTNTTERQTIETPPRPHTYSNVHIYQGVTPRKTVVIELPTTTTLDQESETNNPELSPSNQNDP